MLAVGIGIDLGTANTRAAIFQDGETEIIPDFDGADSFPSSVTINDEHQPYFLGLRAKFRESPKLSLRFGDRGNVHLEKPRTHPSPSTRQRQTDEEPEIFIASSLEAVAAIFHRIMGNVATYLKTDRESIAIWAAISVPALFNENQRQVVRDAAKVVGLGIVSIISTPSAISYARGHANGIVIKDINVRTLILDMGAAFFNAGVAHFNKGTIEMKATYVKRLGGNDLTDGLCDYFEMRIPGFDTSRLQSRRALRNACQQVIRELRLSPNTQYTSGHFRFDHDMVETATKPLLMSTLAAIDKVLRRSSITKDQIQEIVATGGCSHIPILRHLWTEYFDRKIKIRFLKHAEVVGCAMYAARLLWAHTTPTISQDLGPLLQSMPLSIGVGLTSGEYIMIVPSNTPIPNKKSESFVWDYSRGLVRDPQTSTLSRGSNKDRRNMREASKVISLYQGQRERRKGNLFLMRVDLTDIIATSPELHQQKLMISIELDTGHTLDVSVTSSVGMTITNHLDLDRIGLASHELMKLGTKWGWTSDIKKIRSSTNAQRHMILEKLEDLRSLPHGSMQLQEAVDRERSWLAKHQFSSFEDQQAMITRFVKITELMLSTLGEQEEHNKDAPLEIKSGTIQMPMTDEPQDGDTTVMPEEVHRIASNALHNAKDDEAPNNPQIEDTNFESREQQPDRGRSFSKNVIDSFDSTTADLDSLFSPSSQGMSGIYTDANFARLSVYLRNTGHASWSATPRLYTALRLLNYADSLDEFLRLGMNDMCFPFTTTTLPASMSPSMQSAFLEIQGIVYTESKSHDVGRGKHVYFAKDEPKPFQRIALLGRGSHGTVDKVMSQLDQKEYARKLFRRGRGWSQKHIESFRTEVNVLKRVDHIHCIRLISTYSEPGYFALLMMPAGDCNLVEFYRLARINRDKLSLLRGFLGCLTSGVRYLHDSKIRHRDIKPQNVIIKNDQIYLTDFGIAYSWQSVAGATTTADSGKTAIYAAPEVIRVEPRNTAADIWSLGCIFFEIATILCGGSIEDLRANLKHKTDTESYHANVEHLTAWANSLDSGRTDVDSFSWTIALQALQIDATKRPTAAELFEEIVNETHRTGLHFCGPCCLDADVSTSESEAGW